MIKAIRIRKQKPGNGVGIILFGERKLTADLNRDDPDSLPIQIVDGRRQRQQKQVICR
jgi:hypothetical protein